ncbi:predicted protein [Sclerotinia sclerotiorum 1980 UF-70]|uniref:Uncharacterized protein n=1 Tax=Sclerotinia sclerotiorum (strain ATCC 18683 / 1980 / Ss-1) TaxID=665079 RepID=A7E410_SCLS1|nr:predicted protein [Sclerotinia sclerotiorum 1980 UF-70]EDN90632.1 predicted protein [Sclerotinia sclerotiorum 1980 UF-70]
MSTYDRSCIVPIEQSALRAKASKLMHISSDSIRRYTQCQSSENFRIDRKFQAEP